MKKYLILSISLVPLVIVALFFGFGGEAAERVNPLTRSKVQNSSTTPEYLTAGAASSTEVVDISSVKNANLNVYLTASSSAAKFQATIYTTFDESDATTDWFAVHTYSDSGNVRTWGTSPLINAISGNTVSSSTLFSIPLTGLRGNRMKIEYAMASTTPTLGDDNGSVYLELIKESN